MWIPVHHDNRDLEILPNYQPRSQPSFFSQTNLFGKEPAVSTPHAHVIARVQLTCYQAGWLSVFLKIYIKVLSGASDLDLSVEDDKLLVGDRPRQSFSPDAKIPLRER